MRLHRFYISQPLGEVVVIHDGSLLKQWKNVFRYTHGVYLIAFNGDGFDYTYCIESITQKECILKQTEKTSSYIPSKKTTLYLSLIKKDNFELVVQKATELGVTTITPIISQRSEKKNLNEERLLKIATESSEQCGRGDILTISPITSLPSALQNIQDTDTAFFLNMGGISFRDTSFQEKIIKENTLNLFIGPEGGWMEEEELLFQTKKIQALSLGKTVLRAETAAIIASSFAS